MLLQKVLLLVQGVLLTDVMTPTEQMSEQDAAPPAEADGEGRDVSTQPVAVPSDPLAVVDESMPLDGQGAVLAPSSTTPAAAMEAR